MDTTTTLALALGIKAAASAQSPVNRHADASTPPQVSLLNPKLELCRIKPGSTDRTHHIELSVKAGAPNNIAQGEVICRITFGSPYTDGVQTIGIPSEPQIAGFVASSPTERGYDLISSGLQGGSSVSVRPIVVPSTGQF